MNGTTASPRSWRLFRRAVRLNLLRREQSLRTIGLHCSSRVGGKSFVISITFDITLLSEAQRMFNEELRLFLATAALQCKVHE